MTTFLKGILNATQQSCFTSQSMSCHPPRPCTFSSFLTSPIPPPHSYAHLRIQLLISLRKQKLKRESLHCPPLNPIHLPSFCRNKLPLLRSTWLFDPMPSHLLRDIIPIVIALSLIIISLSAGSFPCAQKHAAPLSLQNILP